MESRAVAIVLLGVGFRFFGIGTEAGTDERADSHNDAIYQGKEENAHKYLNTLHSEWEQKAGVEGKQQGDIMKKDTDSR